MNQTQTKQNSERLYDVGIASRETVRGGDIYIIYNANPKPHEESYLVSRIIETGSNSFTHSEYVGDELFTTTSSYNINGFIIQKIPERKPVVLLSSQNPRDLNELDDFIRIQKKKSQSN